jgi:hypothetical protein
MSEDIIVQKFERYFKNPIAEKEILEKGNTGVACRNLRRAISMLTSLRINTSIDVFDEELENAIMEFQKENKHRVIDGKVGLSTRKLITKLLLARFDSTIFYRLTDPRGSGIFSVFISYASADAEIVDKIDQWLRDHGVVVIRDKSWFYAGTSIPENIQYAIIHSDKVICIYSKNSKERDWPKVERDIAEQVEQRLQSTILVYVNLDGSDLPQHDSDRIAISAKGRRLKDVGFEILHAVSGKELPQREYTYDPEEIL